MMNVEVAYHSHNGPYEGEFLDYSRISLRALQNFPSIDSPCDATG